MLLIEYPNRSEWRKILSRPTNDNADFVSVVKSVIDDVRHNGDDAVRKYELKFDGAHLDSLQVTEEEMAEAEKVVVGELKTALKQAYSNIALFHEAQKFEGHVVETQPGVKCWQKSVAIEKVGLYVPGGTAPLFSTVLMLATPAQIAGCRKIVLCTPPDRDGRVNPVILTAAKIAGVNKVFKIGGVQAIASMAYGTESVPKVYKIFGPGNQYVTTAKQLVSLRDVAIDMPAGPSEVMVIADSTSNPAFVAADLLSQAEHGADSQSVLLSTSKALIEGVVEELDVQLKSLPRQSILEKSLEHIRLILLDNDDDVVEMINEYAPEHLIISVTDHKSIADRVVNAGSVFLGHYSCESAGDYASGTNHTLPTNGYAKAYSGVCLDSFMKKITFQELSATGVESIGETVEIMAENESLLAHKNAMTLRLAKVRTEKQ